MSRVDPVEGYEEIKTDLIKIIKRAASKGGCEIYTLDLGFYGFGDIVPEREKLVPLVP